MSTGQPKRLATGGGRREYFVYGLVILSIIVVSLGGYVGYVLYPRFDLPGVTVAGLFALAAGAGVACFFSPCSFPLLVSLFGRSSDSRGDQQPSWRETLPFALSLSFGATVFLLLIGSVVAFAGTAVFADVVFTSTEGIILRSVIGILLILLGLIQFGVIRVPLPPVQDLADPLIDAGTSEHGRAGLGRISLFGFGYLVAGFG